MMTDETLIRNLPFSEAVDIAELVAYEPGQVTSRTLSRQPGVNMTLFAFDKGEGLSGHSAPGDALVHVLDGRVSITIGDKTVEASAGQMVVMPADIPHALTALTPFKMLLVLVKKQTEIKMM